MGVALKKEKEVLQELLGHLPSPSTISRLRRRGELPPSIKVGRNRYCRESDVAAFLDQHASKN